MSLVETVDSIFAATPYQARIEDGAEQRCTDGSSLAGVAIVHVRVDEKRRYQLGFELPPPEDLRAQLVSAWNRLAEKNGLILAQ